MSTSLEMASAARDLLCAIAGPRGWNDTRESWLAGAARKLGFAGVDRPPMDWRDVSDCVKWSRAQARPIRDDIRHFYRVARQANFREVLE